MKACDNYYDYSQLLSGFIMIQVFVLCSILKVSLPLLVENYFNFDRILIRLCVINLLLFCVVMDTEEKPLNPLDSSHGDSAPSDQVYTHASMILGFNDC